LLGHQLEYVVDELRELLEFNSKMRIFIAPPTDRFAVRTHREDIACAVMSIFSDCYLCSFSYKVGFLGLHDEPLSGGA